MNWNIIDQPTAHEWVRALCLTLMHSLWQGLVAAILAGGILLSTRKSKPAFRYNMLALVMLLFVASAVLTFSLMIRNNNAATAVAISEGWMMRVTFQNTGSTAIAVTETGWMMQIMAFFSEHAQLIVAGWFLVFAVKSVLAVSGLLYLRSVAQKVSTPEMKWIVRFYELAERMRIRQEIELRESAQVAVPMVIGFLKPVVLVPLGMLANLPAAQVEAILLHELAHIRRRDYLINLVQVFCENVFFFNPAVWWISKLIREEREHCCDDLAISVMQNKTSFIHALVSFQEYNQSGPVFEMAFSRKRNHLLDRIKRIINNNNKPLDAMEKLFVTFSLAAAVALSAATAPEKPVNRRSSPVMQANRPVTTIKLPEQSAVLRLEPDTLPRKKLKSTEMHVHAANVYSAQEGISTYNVTRNNKQYEIVKRNSKIISLFIDNQEIAESDYAKHQPEIDKIMEEIKVQHELAEKQREQAEIQRKQAGIQRELAEKQREEAGKQRELAEKQREEAQEMRKLAEEQRREAEKMREAADGLRKQAEQMRLDAEKQRAHAAEQRAQAEVQRHKAEEMRKVAEKEREAYIKMQDDVIEELGNAGLVKDKDDLSFKLGDDELIVNGVKQPADLHQKLKSKYLKTEGGKRSEMYYNYNGRSGYSTRTR